MVDGGMKCVKFTLFAFNLLFFLAGLGLIIAGAIVQTKLSTYFDFFGSSVSAAAILLMVVGGIIFIIGFFGCCGAYKENYCMTMTFAVLLGVVFILEIAAGIAAYVMRDQVHDLVDTKMTEAMKNYQDDGFEGVTKAWDTLQHDFKCCGVKNATDWKTSGGLNVVPDSCCLKEIEGCAKDGDKTYTNGCLDVFVSWVKDNIFVIGGVGIGLAVVQVFGVMLACCLARSIRKEYEVV
jgi:CD63 antigen